MNVLFVFMLAASFRLRELLGSEIYPLMFFVFGLFMTLSFFERINKKDLSSFWFRMPLIGNGLVALRGGEQISFWHRQFIFLGGFGTGWLWLVALG